MGHADIACQPLCLELTGIRQLALPVTQIMDLQQINLIGAQATQRACPLRLRSSVAVSSDLGRQERVAAPATLLQQLAQHRIGTAVVG
ncbi:hypothetical protein D3C80_1814020 [compost metagenome]